jgi:hypothetical protein
MDRRIFPKVRWPGLGGYPGRQWSWPYHRSKTLPGKQAAFDAEITAIEEVLKWYQYSDLRHLVIHSDSASAIARASHSGAWPGQRPARHTGAILSTLRREGRTADIQWVKGHSSISELTSQPSKRPRDTYGRNSSPCRTSNSGSRRDFG